MGHRMYVNFKKVRPTDEKFNDMKDLVYMCKKNNISLPKEVKEYFGGHDVDCIDITKYGFKSGDLVEGAEFFTERGDINDIDCYEMNHFIIDLKSIDKDVRYLCIEVDHSY